MTVISDVSHAQLAMWAATFFIAGMGLYGAIFWRLTKGLRLAVLNSVNAELKKLDARKVELVVYLDDKDKAEQILKGLQTTERCALMQRICIGSITPVLAGIKEDLQTVLKNQEELAGTKEILDLVTTRQQEVIMRIDSHINGHSHKDRP